MRDDTTTTNRVRQVIERKRVVDLKTLKRATAGRSQSSLFRDLAKLGYLSSYTHAGCFYSLPGIPKFDEHGLWFHQGIGFSEMGTLKRTVVALVNQSSTGYLHRELESLVRVRVHNTLLSLVRAGRMERESLGLRKFLYVSIDPTRAAAQTQRRRRDQISPQPAPAHPVAIVPTETLIAILVETVHSAKQLASPFELAQRLVARGVAVVPEQVEQVFIHYGIDAQKKTLASRSRRSPK